MTALSPGAVVQAYPVAPPTKGLVASARLPKDDPGVNWLGGFRYAPENCVGGDALSPCGIVAMTPGANLPVVDFIPVGLWAADKCSPNDRTRDYRGRARRLLEANQSDQLAAEFWRGDVAKADALPNRYLADNTHVSVLTAGALSPVNALACLEDGLAACSPQRGMIHCTPGTLVHWQSAFAVERVGQYFLTANDTIVVADTGYDGSGPHGQPGSSGHVWAYGTDLVDVRLGPIDIMPELDNQALDRLVDTFEYRAERLGAATWAGCCHVGVEIDVVTCSHTGGS